MALTAILLSEQRLKQYTSLDINVRVDLITPYLISAQDIYVQDLLGTTFYNRIKSGVILNDLNAQEQELLNDYLQPLIAHYALYFMLPYIKYKIVEKGLLNGTSEETESTNLEDLQYIRQCELDLAQFYQERAREYLRNSPGVFPQYDAWNSRDGMSPNRERPYFSGLVTSGIKRYKTYYGEKCKDDCTDCGPAVT